MSVFEVLMIVCFGFAWPVNLYNSIRTRSTKGKNLLFLGMIVLAYVFGILHKLVYSRDPAIYFYLLNTCMVLADVVLYFVNRRREIKKGLADNYRNVLVD